MEHKTGKKYTHSKMSTDFSYRWKDSATEWLFSTVSTGTTGFPHAKILTHNPYFTL